MTENCKRGIMYAIDIETILDRHVLSESAWRCHFLSGYNSISLVRDAIFKRYVIDFIKQNISKEFYYSIGDGISANDINNYVMGKSFIVNHDDVYLTFEHVFKSRYKDVLSKLIAFFNSVDLDKYSIVLSDFSTKGRQLTFGLKVVENPNIDNFNNMMFNADLLKSMANAYYNEDNSKYEDFEYDELRRTLKKFYNDYPEYTRIDSMEEYVGYPKYLDYVRIRKDLGGADIDGR